MKKTVRSIIQNILAFHHGLSEYFLALNGSAYDQRAKIFLDYLSRREDYISKHLEKYLQDSEDKVLNQWVEVVPWLPSDIFSSCTRDLDICAPLHVEDIIDIAIHYDDCLIEFFTVLVRETECTKAEAVFSNFLNQAKSEEKKLSRDILWLHDM